METISVRQARKLAISCQFPALNTYGLKSKNLTYKLIRHLGYIQIDTLQIVQRAHHHTLWARNPGYKEDHLNNLLTEDRKIFEYWGHAASYLPMEDYRYYLAKMNAFKTPETPWMKNRLLKYGYLLDPVLKRITEEGPLGSKDFRSEKNRKGGNWWDWKPAKAALEILYWQGILMVTRREKFQKIYDLRERVLPDWLDMSVPTPLETGRFIIRRALNSYGLVSMTDIRKHINIAYPGTVEPALNMMEEEGLVTKVLTEFDSSKDYYIFTEVLENMDTNRKFSENLHILSPFDNLIILRDRIHKIFDFQYSLECYLPVKKRRYGYFVLPILSGDQFIGRLDAKADRKNSVFQIHNIYFENQASGNEEFLVDLAQKIAAFAIFNTCRSIQITRHDGQHSGIIKKLEYKINIYLDNTI